MLGRTDAEMRTLIRPSSKRERPARRGVRGRGGRGVGPRARARRPVGACPPNTVVLPVPRVHRGVRLALAYAHCLSNDVRAVYVEVDPAETERVRRDWAALETPVRLEVVPSPYRPTSRYCWRT